MLLGDEQSMYSRIQSKPYDRLPSTRQLMDHLVVPSAKRGQKWVIVLIISTSLIVIVFFALVLGFDVGGTDLHKATLRWGLLVAAVIGLLLIIRAIFQSRDVIKLL